jgi:hypothetical protein
MSKRLCLLWGSMALLILMLLGLLFYCSSENRVLLKLQNGVTLSSEAMETLCNEALFSAVHVYTNESASAATSSGKNTTVTCWRIDDQTIAREQLLSGRTFFAEDETQDFIIIDHDTAETLFGRLDVVGETIKLGADSYQILGVLQEENNLAVRLASYGMRNVFLLHRAEDPVTYITADLQSGISGNLALSWLTQNSALSSSVEKTVNLQAVAGFTGFIARVFLMLYTVILFRLVWQRTRPMRNQLQSRISNMYASSYLWSFMRQASTSIGLLTVLTAVPWVALLTVLHVLFNAEGIPSSLRPARLMLSSMKQAAENLVAFVNSQVNDASCFTAPWIWVRMAILLLGVLGLLILMQLVKRNAMAQKEAKE